MLQTLIEQGRITDEKVLKEIRGGAGLTTIMIDALRARQINAEDLRIDPCSGSVVILDVNTGKTLALVNYPSYDANRLVGNFDTKYYSELLNNTTTPMLNRALAQRKAPGSVFKMITAIAGLETGKIDTRENIHKLFVMVLQDTWLFNGTIKENIRFNQKDITDEEVRLNDLVYELYGINNKEKAIILANLIEISEAIAADVNDIQERHSRRNVKASQYIINDETLLEWIIRTECTSVTDVQRYIHENNFNDTVIPR